MVDPPTHLDLKRDRGLTVQWADGSSNFYPIKHLRRMSPSAESKMLREELEKNPLAVMPSSGNTGTLTATGMELVGNYAIRIRFSDGHDTGIYSWRYLREIAPQHDASSSEPNSP